jgi:hypothetical protein
MKTTIDTDNVLYELLKNSSLKSAITGKVYKRQRPVNSVLEDVVINSLPISNEQLQQCVSNVNVFVPDIQIVTDGVFDKVADEVRLSELSILAVQILTDGISGDFTWDIQQQTLIKDDESDSHYINIRINFFVSNI